jgi:hypothetical protein
MSVIFMVCEVKLIGVRSTLIWSIKGDKSQWGLPHGGVPQIVSPHWLLSPLIGN